MRNKGVYNNAPILDEWSTARYNARLVEIITIYNIPEEIAAPMRHLGEQLRNLDRAINPGQVERALTILARDLDILISPDLDQDIINNNLNVIAEHIDETMEQIWDFASDDPYNHFQRTVNNIVTDDEASDYDEDNSIGVNYLTDIQYNNLDIPMNIGKTSSIINPEIEQFANNFASHPVISAGNSDSLFIVVIPSEIMSINFEQLSGMIKNIYNWCFSDH